MNSQGRKFDVAYPSAEDLRKTITSHPILPFSVERLWAQCYLDIITEGSLGYEGANLNELCPGVRPMGIEEFLKKWWRSGV